MSDLIKRLRGWPGPRGGEVPYLQTMTEAADEIEKLRAALTIPKRTLELFERVASKMVSEGYAQGYREACNHIMDKLGEKK
jgi:uncharacterized Zn finger protein